MKRSPCHVIPPPNGWEPQTYYVVECACCRRNPVWMGIFYSGFLDDNGHPCGYNEVINCESRPSIEELYFLKVVQRVGSRRELEQLCPHLGMMLTDAILPSC